MAELQNTDESIKDWRIQHGKVIRSFLEYLNGRTDAYVLIGDTALYLCYELDRFSEDIDLDGRENQLTDLVDGFCKENGYMFRIAKDTNTVQRYMVNYGNSSKPLKIEASYRRREIPGIETVKINGILAYRIEHLCVMKVNAYTSRDRIRDLYDLTFISNHYFDRLPAQTVELVRNALEYKGLEQFDYMIKTQPDELINADRLALDFLIMYERIGLLFDESEIPHLAKRIPDIENGHSHPLDEDEWEQ